MTADLAQLVALLAAGTLSIVVFTALLGRRDAPGATGFMVLAVGVAIWAIASALMQVQESDRAADFWYDVSLVGSTMLATSWFAMALQYTGRGALLTRRVIALLFIEPVLFLSLAFLNGNAGAGGFFNRPALRNQQYVRLHAFGGGLVPARSRVPAGPSAVLGAGGECGHRGAAARAVEPAVGVGTLAARVRSDAGGGGAGRGGFGLGSV
jgi:hypothetical protein